MASKLDLAHAQFIGFHHGRWSSHDILGLIKGMGLTKQEWKKYKEQYDSHSLTESDINEIESYFKSNK